MDLTFLPDEMLANVLKFSKFETIVRLRKTNVRVDQLTVRCGINKPKCSYIEVENHIMRVQHKKLDMEENPASPYPDHEHIFQCSDPFAMLEKSTKKLRFIESIRINRQDVDLGWLNLLDSMKQRHRIKVSLMQCNYTVSLDDLKQTLSKFDTVEFYMSTWHTVSEERVTTDKVVGYILTFAELTIGISERQKILPEITDKTLKKLQTDLSKDFCISGHFTNFSLSEVIKTFKMGIMNPCKSPRYWNLGKVKVNSIDEMNKAFNELSSIKGIRIIDRRTESLCMNVIVGISRQELVALLQEEELQGAMLAVLANKQDIPGCLTPAEAHKALGLEALRNRTLQIFKDKLSPYCFMTVFRLADVSLLFFSAQQPMIFQNILFRFDLIGSGPLLSATENGTFVRNFVIICEMFILCIFSTILLRSSRNAMFDVYHIMKSTEPPNDSEASMIENEI